MSTDRIPVAGPWITEKEIRYVADAAANDWYSRAGESIGKFERAFAEHVGVAHAVAVPHCTAALHLALMALDVGPGDEVIVPDITWVATAAPVFYVGATPVFADIDPVTWCVSAETLAPCITPRTKAIITVDLYGGMPNMDEIRALAEAHGIPIIEDAAEAAGAEWKGERAGSLGKIGTFSFHGSKTLTTGEGGMFVTDDPDINARVLFLRDHGRPPGSHRFFLTTEVGYKYRMSSLQAAFGLAQLERIDELITRKRQIFGWYADRLADVPGLVLNAEEPGSMNVYWMVTAVLDASYQLKTPDLMDELLAEDIESRPFFHPLSALPAFADAPDAGPAAVRNVVSYDISPRAINLPSALILTEAQVDQVCTSLRGILSRHG
jgi:perosamine synthetase